MQSPVFIQLFPSCVRRGIISLVNIDIHHCYGGSYVPVEDAHGIVVHFAGYIICYSGSKWFHCPYFVGLLALGQAYDCPGANGVILNDIGKTRYQTTTKPNKAQNVYIVLGM